MVEPSRSDNRSVAASAARTPADDWERWFAGLRAHVDDLVSAHLNTLKPREGLGARLLESVAYSWSSGGKRVRPALTLECCRVCGGRPGDADCAALAVEAIHAFSLIHDDLPAMDDDDLRRGRPTNHKVYGEALAILAGDWLVAHAFELLTNSPRVAAVPGLTATLARGTQKMAFGQAADIVGEGRPADPEQVRFIHEHKTAGLIEASCRLGAQAAGAAAEQEAALGRFGVHLGLAFQIQDDVLDETTETATLGKTAGKDAAAAKQTYPAAFGLDEARRLAQSEVEAAVAALAPFGPAAARLRGFAEFVLRREH